MIGLSAVGLLWLVLFVAVVTHRGLPGVLRPLLGIALLAYGLASISTLAAGYFHARGLLQGLAERQAEARAHMTWALETLPDTVRHKLPVLAAMKLQERMAKATAEFGPRVWSVEWRWGVLPAFKTDLLAKNLMAHVGTPPLIVYAVGEHARNASRFFQAVSRYDTKFPMGQSRTARYIDFLMEDDLAAQQSAQTLCEAVDFHRDDPGDPRSRSYLLGARARQMAGKQAKIRQLMEVAFDAFDQFLFLRVRRCYPANQTGEWGWQPYSALFMEYAQLLQAFQGLNTLEIRWLGDPPVPVVGSADALYRLECEASGRWPAGQETWTDPQTGKSGPTYYVNAATCAYYTEGVEFSKWPSQPDLRSVGITATDKEWRFAGLPVVIVGEKLFLPPNMDRPRP